jgi:hypothetical protein
LLLMRTDLEIGPEAETIIPCASKTRLDGTRP